MVELEVFEVWVLAETDTEEETMVEANQEEYIVAAVDITLSSLSINPRTEETVEDKEEGPKETHYSTSHTTTLHTTTPNPPSPP